MIEDGEESSETHSVFNQKAEKDQPLADHLLEGLWEIRESVAAATQLVDEMCEEVDRLRKERNKWQY